MKKPYSYMQRVPRFNMILGIFAIRRGGFMCPPNWQALPEWTGGYRLMSST